MMFGFLRLAALVAGPMPNDSDIEYFHYHPQVIILNRILAQNHKNGTRDFDPAPWTERAQYVGRIEGSALSWRAHLQRTLPSELYDRWDKEMDWRYECWNYLDDVVNGHRYGWTTEKKRYSLARLRDLLGDERFYSGWMPPPVPSYTPETIQWLQDLWSERTGFQGKKNVRENVNPIQVPE